MRTKFIQALFLVFCLYITNPIHETNAAPNAACMLTWTIVSSPAPVSGQYVLNNVDAASNEMWAVGHFSPPSGPSQTLIEHWNGTMWSKHSSPSVANKSNELKSVAVLAGDDAWAVGMATENGYSQTLIQHWNGSNWSIISSPNTPSGFGNLYSVDGAASNDVWAVGGWNGATLLLHWDGTSWQPMSAPTRGELKRVIALATNDVWVLGQESGLEASVLHWDGATWQIHSTIPLDYIPGYSGTLERVYDLYVSSPGDMWVVGEKNQMRYQDNAQRRHWDGTSWTVVNPPDDVHGALYAIAGTQTDNLWSVGNNPYYTPVFLSQWDGSGWTNRMMQDAFGSGELRGITAISNQEFWLVGDVVNAQPANAALIVHGTLPCETVPQSAPVLTTPRNKAILRDLRPTFKWNPVTGATYYKLELRLGSRKGKIIDTLKYNQTHGRSSRALTASTYFWRVRACSTLGCGDWSSYFKFTIQR